jgi:hypothetical protein
MSLDAQRFALPAGGQDEIKPIRRKWLECIVSLFTAANPTSRVHAWLGRIPIREEEMIIA